MSPLEPWGRWYDGDGHIIGITLVNTTLLLDRGDIHVTVPEVVDVQCDQLKLALARAVRRRGRRTSSTSVQCAV